MILTGVVTNLKIIFEILFFKTFNLVSNKQAGFRLVGYKGRNHSLKI